ncbi:pantoate--beta-alanine ligase [Rhodovulum sulfidophilum]|uniref:Pantothenate synthetase n=1 Tax=Rhodovulum visakhapatnamense TaxID=364297 RepID=A0ABS1RI07_9RHOB|nr:pantoate--beta-alanine ligase [Rhodovulum visakhapatnamense]MBL3570575.1 pantoate--beta-alanine ligase [Rhodovulum visakhapatnamense]MBL3579155.1 pantoate--beta-alanine ligase [Rhodovulum visakhapatnamense]OLS43900.1 pantoate--beta-alanine ligase [Rhodovulum sulfidophilum]
MTAPILRSLEALRAVGAEWRAEGARVAVVPTMGALHDGHLSLAAAAKAAADRVIVTIFVNPRQFNDPGDLARYPRTEARDAEKLAPLGVDALYVPAADQVYPPGFATSVSVSGVSEGLCGAHRPGHFDGVATVVTKLLLQTGADCAFFGEKDFQQLMVVRRLVRDLDIPVEIVGCPTVREPDGLALSSRNALLPGDSRAMAPALYRALEAARQALEAGTGAETTLATARAAIMAAGFAEVEYLELRAAADLAPLEAADVPARLLVAAHLGGVRLIDNIPVAAR